MRHFNVEFETWDKNGSAETKRLTYTADTPIAALNQFHRHMQETNKLGCDDYRIIALKVADVSGDTCLRFPPDEIPQNPNLHDKFSFPKIDQLEMFTFDE